MLRDFQVTLTIEDVQLWIHAHDNIGFDINLHHLHAYNMIYNAIEEQILNDTDNELFNEIKDSENG